MTVTVRATQRGYYAFEIQDPGAVFTLSDPVHFSFEWMECLDQESADEVKRALETKKRKEAARKAAATRARKAADVPVVAAPVVDPDAVPVELEDDPDAPRVPTDKVLPDQNPQTPQSALPPEAIG